MGMSRVVRSGASSPLLQGASCGAHIIYVFRGQGQGWGPFFVECRFNTITERVPTATPGDDRGEEALASRRFWDL